MASAGLTFQPRCGSPALATTYEGGNPQLLERILALVDHVEISPDSISCAKGDSYRLNPKILGEFSVAGMQKSVLVHGVGLSIASADGFSESYVRLLDEVFSHFDVAWHSEHLAYTMVEGEPLGTMLVPPRTEEMLDLLCERVSFLLERYRVPFLLENVIRLLPDYPAEFSEAEFLNEISGRTGCGILLDAYNLECDAANHGFDVEGFLDELDLSRVREIHIAGGVSHAGFQLDVHSRHTAESTIAMAKRIVERAPQAQAVTYEYLKEAIPQLGIEGICEELKRRRKDFCS